MFLNRLYYMFKPFIPWSLRLALRRNSAARRKKNTGVDWPIMEAAGSPPAGWPGWPGGKKFALVLTHDVEGSLGLGRVPQLMKLEKDLGFHSSFNFIPEGEY